MPLCDAVCIVEMTIMSLVWCAAVGLNCLTLVAFYQRRNGRRPSSHRFLFSLTCANCLIALLVLPVFGYRIVHQAQAAGIVFAALTAYLLGVTVFSILLIGWDRFLACARNPLFYNRNMSFRRSIFLIIASWAVPAVILTPAVMVSPTDSMEIKWRSSGTAKTTAVIFSFGNYFLPLLALAAIYTKVFCAAKTSTTSQGRKNLVFEFDNNFALRRSLTIDMAKSGSNSTGSPFTRQNSTSSFQSFLSGQERQKAAHIIIWILITFVGLYSLFFTDIVIRAFFPDIEADLPVSFTRAIHILYFLGTIFNPVLYILCNSGLRRDIRRVFMRQEEIRRQSSLQLQVGGGFRHHSSLWHSTSESRCFARQQSLDLSTAKSYSTPLMLPIITCTSPEMEDFHPDEDDELYFPDGDTDCVGHGSDIQGLSQCSTTDADREPFVLLSGRSASLASSRSLSRKSVSWEDTEGFEATTKDSAN